MKKIISVLAFAAIVINVSIAQTTAKNWTATDCNGATHTLFDELDKGKVIVFTWVMPCVSCKAPSKTAYDAVQAYSAGNPGKVLFYMADDLGDDACSDLTSWVTSTGIGDPAKMTIFGNSGNVINENDFGGTGMPHIIVMGGKDHKIFFNKKNSSSNDAAGIKKAIDSAIVATGIRDIRNQIKFAIGPNPTGNVLFVNYEKPITKVTITSVTGQLLKEQIYSGGKTNPVVNVSELASGMYFIVLTDIDFKTGIEKIVKQ